MRLQKFMADAGIASRRKCEEYIAEGRVKVNGNTAVIGCTVEDGDEVLFDGNPVCGKTARVAISRPEQALRARDGTPQRTLRAEGPWWTM